MSDHGEWKRLGDGALLTEDADVGLGHIVPVATYNKVLAALLVLTALTVLAATQHFGALNVPIALAIAVVKAGIVTLFFMHLKFEKLITWVVVCYPIIIIFLMMIGTLGDVSVKDVPTPAVVAAAK